MLINSNLSELMMAVKTKIVNFFFSNIGFIVDWVSIMQQFRD